MVYNRVQDLDRKPAWFHSACVIQPVISSIFYYFISLTRYCRGVYPHCLRRTGEARQILRNVFLHVSSTSISENRWLIRFHKTMLAVWFFCPPWGSAHKCSLIPVPTWDVLKIPVPYVPNMAKLINSIFGLSVKAIWNFALLTDEKFNLFDDTFYIITFNLTGPSI